MIKTCFSYLYPMDAANINPNQISRSLHKSVTWNASFSHFFHFWPPWPMQIIYVIFCTKILQSTPIIIRYPKPFWISRSNIDVNCAKIVVFSQLKENDNVVQKKRILNENALLAVIFNIFVKKLFLCKTKRILCRKIFAMKG